MNSTLDILLAIINAAIEQNKVPELIFGLLCASQEFPEWGQAMKEAIKELIFTNTTSKNSYYETLRKLVILLKVDDIN